MSCVSCGVDYGLLEEKIERGELTSLDQLTQDLVASNGLRRGTVIFYCPSCQEVICRLRDRVAARLRQQTLQNLPAILDRAQEKRRQTRQGKG